MRCVGYHVHLDGVDMGEWIEAQLVPVIRQRIRDRYWAYYRVPAPGSNRNAGKVRSGALVTRPRGGDPPGVSACRAGAPRGAAARPPGVQVGGEGGMATSPHGGNVDNMARPGICGAARQARRARGVDDASTSWLTPFAARALPHWRILTAVREVPDFI